MTFPSIPEPAPSTDPGGDWQRVKSSLGRSIVRTTVPFAVGLIVTALAKLNLTVDGQSLTGLITLGVSTGYYGIVRIAEQRLSEAWGWLLGAKGAPAYRAPAPSRTA